MLIGLNYYRQILSKQNWNQMENCEPKGRGQFLHKGENLNNIKAKKQTNQQNKTS